jgi:uncharacterized repeat protein (TIGR01451 family)
MSHQRQRSFAMSLLLTGLLVTLLSLGGGWGQAYGQTAGPTPTPSRTAVITVTKEVDNPRPRQGQTVVFTIRVQNTGDVPARDVVVQDNMPGSLEILDVATTAGTASVRGPTVRVEIAQLDPGASVVITIRARLRPDARGHVENIVIVRASNIGGATVEHRARAVLEVAESAADEPATPNAGAQNPRGALGNTGADATIQWWLLLLGLVLMAVGSAIFWRARRTR